MDHRFLSPDEMLPGVRIEGASFLVDLMADHKCVTFQVALGLGYPLDTNTLSGVVALPSLVMCSCIFRHFD